MSGPGSDMRLGNALPLREVPLGTAVHNVELKIGKGGQMARSAGTSGAGGGQGRRLRDAAHGVTEMRLVHGNCLATIGEVGNAEHELISGQGGQEPLAGQAARRCAAR
jgi:large subunit ribosomal protein L2